jgi:hypothetical protein
MHDSRTFPRIHGLRAHVFSSCALSCIDIDYQIAELKESRAHIIGLFTTMDNVRCIGMAMAQAGLSGDGYFWLTMWADVDTALWNNDTSSVYLPLFQNIASLVRFSLPF